MKKLLFILYILSLIMTSCETSNSVNKQIDYLITERESLKKELSNLRSSLDVTKKEYDIKQDELKTMNIYLSGKTPKYIVKLKLKQSHMSLSLSQHAKDAMNAVEFELPVDKEFYDSVEKGSEVLDEFRVGSLIMKGSFGSWKMKVVDKYIK